jgi:hypothetical protein
MSPPAGFSLAISYGQETQPTLNSALCLRVQTDGRHLIRPIDAPIPLGEARHFALRIAITMDFILKPWLPLPEISSDTPIALGHATPLKYR